MVHESEQLTCTAKSLAAHPSQHVEAKVAVSRFVKVLQSPHVSPVISHILERLRIKINIMKDGLQKSLACSLAARYMD